jgi:hypothetical protein
MASLLKRLANHLRVVDFMSLFFGKNYLHVGFARKGWERKNSELRDQVGLLSSEFSTKGKQLRESSRKSTESGAGMVDLYKELGKRAKAVSTLIDKELPNLVKLYEPVGELYTTYQEALDAYNAFMATWIGRLPESDLTGRALELALQEIERSLR